MCLTGRKAGSGVLSFLRGAGVSREPSPKLSRKDQECVEAVRYTPRIDWDSLEGTPPAVALLATNVFLKFMSLSSADLFHCLGTGAGS